jgi:hypothetical protein
VSDVDAFAVECGCGWRRPIPSVGEFPDVFAALQKHLAVEHPVRRAVAILMVVTVTEIGE